MAAGDVVTTTSVESVATTSHGVSIPATTAGDLQAILVAVNSSTGDIINTPAGWTQRVANANGNLQFALFTRTAPADALAATVFVTTGESVTSGHIGVNVEMANYAIAASVLSGTSATVSVANEAISPFEGVAVGFAAFTAGGVSSYPTPLTEGRKWAAASNHSVGVAASAVVTDTSGTKEFGLSSSGQWLSVQMYATTSGGASGEFTEVTDLGGTLGSAEGVVPEPVRGSMLPCCSSATGTDIGGVLGSATWVAQADRDADGLDRYYPLGADQLEFEAGTNLPNIGREIANGVLATAAGPLTLAPDIGKLCELPEVFRRDRVYSVPVAILPWNVNADWTVSLLFNLNDLEAEQTLFALNPSIRLGVSWARELVVSISERDGTLRQNWSATKLTEGSIAHIALARSGLRFQAYLHGVPACQVEAASLKPVTSCTIGSWQGASLASGEMQDVRIYDHAKQADFLAAEAASYCNDWVSVVQE